MPVEKGKRRPEYSPDERAVLVERICELYETQNASAESCCEAANVSYRVFMLWIGQNSAFAERYKKAKQKQDAHYWENVIRPLAKTSLQRLLEGEETQDVEVRQLHDKGIPTKDADGNVHTVTTQKTSRTLPNPTAVIFALKGEFPERFADRSEVNLKTEQPQLLTITPDKIAQIEAIIADAKQDANIQPVPGKRKA